MYSIWGSFFFAHNSSKMPAVIVGPSNKVSNSLPQKIMKFRDVKNLSLVKKTFPQGSRLGRYQEIYEDAAHRGVYKQDDGPNYLFWLESRGMWMVGETVGVDSGLIRNRAGGVCPEDLVMDWEYWMDWQSVRGGRGFLLF